MTGDGQPALGCVWGLGCSALFYVSLVLLWWVLQEAGIIGF